MLPLLGEAGVIDDPRLDRPMRLERRKYDLAYLGHHLLVRPIRLVDKVEQRLVLGRGSSRRSHCRDRLHALAFTRAHQPNAIDMQRSSTRRMPDNPRNLLNVRSKPSLTLTNAVEIHRSLLASKCESPQYDIHTALALRPGDSVRLARDWCAERLRVTVTERRSSQAIAGCF